MSDIQISKASNDKPSRRFRWLSGWSRLFFEMLAITFGVLLAFGLNAWWEGRTQAKFDSVSLSQVYDEIDRNYETIEKAYQYRLDLYPRIIAVEQGKLTTPDIEFKGIRPPRIETAAYDLALARGLFGRINQDEAQTLVKTYLDFENIKSIHELYGSSLPTLILQMENQNDGKFVTFMRMAFMDMIFAEGETLNSISEFSEKPTLRNPWEFISNSYQLDGSKSVEPE